MSLKWNGAKLEKLRGRKTQVDLAAALRSKGFGTTQTTVSRWESGQQPRAYIIDALAAEIGCTTRELFDEDEAEAAPMAAGSPLTHEELEILGDLMARLIRPKVAA
jgi:transcriptional regulator with XRE-family HTH domain